MDDIDVSDEEAKISNSLFNRLQNIKLVDKYNAYQILDDNWNIISGDLELIKAEGIVACNKIDPIYEVKKKGDKETEVQVGVKGHIIPLDYVIDYKLKNLKNEVKSKENRLSEVESRINEVFDSLDEDEKSEIEDILTDDNDAFVPKEVLRKAKEYLKASISEGTVEKKIIEVSNLFDEQKRLNKDIKDSNNNIEVMAQKEIENLTYDDVCNLLEKKWIEPIVNGIDKLIDDIIINFAKNIEKLSSKYEQTLKDIDEDISKSESELSNMIGELTGSEYDMKGMEDFRALFNGD